MNLLVVLGYFFIYLLPPTTLIASIITINYIDARWSPERACAFKARGLKYVVVLGLCAYAVLFFIGLLLTGGGMASPW